MALVAFCCYLGLFVTFWGCLGFSVAVWGFLLLFGAFGSFLGAETVSFVLCSVGCLPFWFGFLVARAWLGCMFALPLLCVCACVRGVVCDLGVILVRA